MEISISWDAVVVFQIIFVEKTYLIFRQNRMMSELQAVGQYQYSNVMSAVQAYAFKVLESIKKMINNKFLEKIKDTEM